jgi:hypothetical protein
MVPDERRSRPRESLPIALQMQDGSSAVVRDVSEAGMYVVLPHDAPAARWCTFEFTSRQTCLRFRAIGEVVRFERGSRSDGMAIRLHRLRIARRS